jgi:pectin methylesterase-like acyl-CoA thioesterase
MVTRLAGLVVAVLLAVTSPVAHADRSPRLLPNNGCVDAPLRIAFPSAPQPGATGTIDVHRRDGTVVDSIDLADPNSAEREIGGAVSDTGVPHQFHYNPVLVDGDVASIYPHRRLGYDQSYYLTVSAGVFAGYQAFRTQPLHTRRPPRAGRTELIVSADGAGDFCSVQGAIDYVPVGNQRPVTVDVRRGVYTEIDYVRADRPHLTVRGAGAGSTVIRYPDNDKLNGDAALDKTLPANVCPLRALPTPDLTNCWRALFGVDAPDFTLTDITLHNTTPFGGSQAEAFRGNNQHITLNRVRLLSFQDTLRLQGTGFVTNSYVEGDVDFVWGTGSVFVQRSELKAMHAGYYTQIRNDSEHYGDVFVDDRLTEDAGVPAGSVYLGRIQLTRFPASQAEYVDDAMGPHVTPVGWQLTSGFGDCTQAQSLRYGEYHSTDLAGNPLDTSQRLACSTQLSDADAARLRDPANVLSGWVPTTVNTDGTLVNWSAPVGHSANDRIVAINRLGLPVAAVRVGSTATTGTLRLNGHYRVAYLPAGALLPTATGSPSGN